MTELQSRPSVWYWAISWFALLWMAFGVLAWLGLYLRDERLRALLPLRTRA